MSFTDWYRKAEEGNADAQAEIGRRYFRGTDNIKRHYPAAIYWYKKAADQNEVTAIRGLGLIYSEGILSSGYGIEQNLEEAFYWFHKAAKLGDRYSQNKIGDMYFYGKGVEQDYQEAMKWYIKSTEDNNTYIKAYSLDKIGQMYENGYGVKKDKEEAIECYLKSIDGGNPQASISLALIHQKTLEENAKQGNPEDQCRLARMYYQGTVSEKYKNYVKDKYLIDDQISEILAKGCGIEEYYVESVKWLRMAAEQGYAEAQHRLGLMYQNGKGIDKDDTEAFNWCKLAANQGYDLAQYSIGCMYRNGWGVEQDYTEALHWYKLAGEQGHVIALICIAMMYRDGVGVEQSEVVAREWFQKANEKTSRQHN